MKIKADQEAVLTEAKMTIDTERATVAQLHKEISILKQQIGLLEEKQNELKELLIEDSNSVRDCNALLHLFPSIFNCF